MYTHVLCSIKQYFEFEFECYMSVIDGHSNIHNMPFLLGSVARFKDICIVINSLSTLPSMITQCNEIGMILK